MQLLLETVYHGIIVSFQLLRNVRIHDILHILVEPLGHLLLFFHSKPPSVDVGHLTLILHHAYQSVFKPIRRTESAVADTFLGLQVLPRLA